MEHLDIILPILLLFLTYGVKLLVDQAVEVPMAIKSLCELPIDIIFLSMSFLIAIIISSNENRNASFLCIMIFFFLSLIIVLLSKRSILNFDKRINKNWILYLSINFLIAIVCLGISIKILTTPAVKSTPKPETNSTVNGKQ